MSYNGLNDEFVLINKIEKFAQTNTNNFEQERDKVVLFKSEKAGTGRGEKSTKVINSVEKLNEIIYLQRFFADYA